MIQASAAKPKKYANKKVSRPAAGAESACTGVTSWPPGLDESKGDMLVASDGAMAGPRMTSSLEALEEFEALYMPWMMELLVPVLAALLILVVGMPLATVVVVALVTVVVVALVTLVVVVRRSPDVVVAVESKGEATSIG